MDSVKGKIWLKRNRIPFSLDFSGKHSIIATPDGLEIRDAALWLAEIDLRK
jgi:hypothetical protein